MRKFIIAAILIVAGLVVLLAATGFVLAEKGPIRPGNPLFTLQDFSEQQRARLIASPTQRAHFYLDLLARRTSQLANLSGRAEETAGLQALGKSLDQSVNVLSSAPESDLEDLKTRLASLLIDVQSTLAGLQTAPQASPELFTAVQDLTNALQNMVGAYAILALADGQIPQPIQTVEPQTNQGVSSSPTQAAQGTITPLAVAFPPGSAGAQHTFFPLYGKHATLTCETCHVDGVYAGTPSRCSDCHIELLPVGHYPGECATCHLSTTWKEIAYSHPNPTSLDCQLCHLRVRPVNHYNGQCSTCHTTLAWKPANFDHLLARASNCQSCHSNKRPANHYSGQCSACHNTRGWLPANFDHKVAGATNCQTCHSDDRPANHFGGQCSACHSTSGWRPARFDHKLAGATDCQSCHSRPSGHFGGQCSSCHGTNNWQPNRFDHKLAGATDCQSCHENNRPAGHYSGNCSACHDTSSWQNATFSHSGLKDCQSCHSAPGDHWNGQCSNCHSPGSWSNVNVSGHRFSMNHGDAGGDCATCHPGNKISVNCYSCHDKGETEKHHNEEGILDIAGRCLECHPDGEKD